MATKQQLFNQVVAYGIQNRKKKDEIMSALLQSGQFDVVQSASALKALTDLGSFDYQQDTKGPLDIDRQDLSATQNTAYGFGTRTLESGGIISQLEKNIAEKGFGESLSYAAQKKAAGGIITGRFAGEDVKKIDQAQRDFINAVLRRESGAAIAPSEFESAEKQYFPVPGDTTDVLEQKRKNRELVTKNLLGESGVDVDRIDFNKLSQQVGQPMQTAQQAQPTQQANPQFQQAMAYAQQNPNDPKAQQLLQMVQSGQIDPSTGQRVGATTQTAQPTQQVGQIAPQETKDEKGIFGRFFSSAVEEIPELAGELGTRLKNIWDNTVTRSEEAKDESVFTSVLRGFETQFRNLGEVGGAVGDVATSALELAYDIAVPEEAREEIKKTASDFIQTPAGQTAIQALQGGTERWEEFKKNSPNVAKDMEAAFNIVTAIPSVAGLKVAGKGTKLATTEAKALTSDVIEAGARATGKTGIEEASNKVFKAIKPSITVKRDKKFIRQTLDSANEELVKRGLAPKNFKEYAENLGKAKNKVWSEIESKLGAGVDKKVDVGSIAKELKEMASSKTLQLADTNAVKRINAMADNLISQGNKLSVQEAEKLKQFVNSELSGAFGKFNLSNAEQNAMKLVTQKIGEQLDKTLSKIPGEFSDLKKKYGALKQVEEDALKRLIVFERQNPQGLVESFSKISGIGNILKGFVPGGGGLSSIAKGASEIGLGQLQKRANDADQLIKSAFEKLSKRTGTFKPQSKLLNYTKGKAGMSIKDVSKKGEGAIPKIANFERAKNLTPEGRKIEDLAFKKISKHEDKILQQYDKKYGKVVNTDNFRQAFKKEGYKGYNAADVQEPSSYLSKKAFTANLSNEGKYATMYAGGSGTGKTSAIKNISSVNQLVKDSAVILDSNLSSYDSAVKKITEAVKAGKKTPIVYVYRDPVDSFVNGVVKRMLTNTEEAGRLVPSKITAANHIDSFNVVKRLEKEGIDVIAIDNSLGRGKAIKTNLSKLSNKIKYPSKKELTNIFNKEAKKLYEQGKITREQYQGYIE